MIQFLLILLAVILIIGLFLGVRRMGEGEREEYPQGGYGKDVAYPLERLEEKANKHSKILKIIATSFSIFI